jgi:DNA-binding NtrC family response regulator
VVDDDAAVRQSISESLSTYGHIVFEAENGDAGLSVLQENSADVAVVDFAMPGMNGAAFAQLARATHERLPVVFMSGYSDANAILEAVGQGATLLRKPFEASALLHAISRATAN